MKQQRQREQKTSRPRKNYDYNKPTGKCIVCYFLSGWHCYDCDNDFCELHFQDHKERNLCIKVT